MTTSEIDNCTAANHFIGTVRERVGQVVVGQETVVERALVALLTGGHLLLQGVPGIGKTLLVNALANAVDLKFSRVQFTIDMLPSDIIGSVILDQSSNEFRTHKGPIFTNLLLADEINRAAPKVQSALLEAMQERKVTIGNTTNVLPAPFLVIATQNPIEQSGTFELPEAQLDRFMLCHRLVYPSVDEEEEIVNQQLSFGLRIENEGAVPKSAFDMLTEAPVTPINDLTEAMGKVQEVHVSDVFVRQCIELVRRTREHPNLEIGGSPRAAMALVQAARARALIHGRDYAIPDDLFALAEDVILHRIRLTYGALAEGATGADTLKEILVGVG
jgi:MoxR-like ATPase